jgi:hypothetical protein
MWREALVLKKKRANHGKQRPASKQGLWELSHSAQRALQLAGATHLPRAAHSAPLSLTLHFEADPFPFVAVTNGALVLKAGIASWCSLPLVDLI